MLIFFVKNIKFSVFFTICKYLISKKICVKILWVIKMHYVYILECADGTLYTGWTTNLEKRIETHNLKKGAKYTKSRTPVTLFYKEEFETKSEAMKREAQIKKLPRSKKLLLKE